MMIEQAVIAFNDPPLKVRTLEERDRTLELWRKGDGLQIDVYEFRELLELVRMLGWEVP